MHTPLHTLAFLLQQAERWGTELVTDDVELVDLSVRPFRIRTADREVRAMAC